MSVEGPRLLRTPSGITVAFLATPGRRRAHLGLHVRVGSRFEDARTNGLSHFLEHMMYRGTTGLPTAHAVNAAFEGLGGMLYAHTQVDAGLFSVTLPKESLAEAAPLFGRVVTAPAFSAIAVERNIVREEILEDLDDDGRDVDPDNLVRALAYGAHPLGFPITGPIANVERFTEDDLRAHFARHYTRANVVVALAADLDSAAVGPLVDGMLAAMPAGERRAVKAPPPPRRGKARVVTDPGSQTALRLSFRARAAGDAGRAPLELLLRVLDDGMSTRLYHRVCDELGLCYDTSAHWDAYEDDGVVDLAASATHERVPTIAAEVFGLLGALAADGPTADELAAAKRRKAWDLESFPDAPEDLVDHVASEALFGRAVDLAAERARTLAVTAEEVAAAAREVFRPERLAAVAVGAPDRETRRAFADLLARFGVTS